MRDVNVSEGMEAAAPTSVTIAGRPLEQPEEVLHAHLDREALQGDVVARKMF